MKEIFIKYNPYKLETTVEIEGKGVKSNSAFNVGEKRLQEWVEELPKILLDECNSNSFKIIFHGTLLDYEDILEVAKRAQEKGIKIECVHKKAKEVADKEEAIKQIFREIQDGPFEELKQKDVIHAFEMASNKDFEVNVIATMSAGKSTLINSLLRKKLMPAKQEACTATITKIKDNDSEVFRADIYDKDGQLIQVQDNVNLNIMENLNANQEVSEIDLAGDIPFVDADDIALVLVDTPGPNNSRDLEHKVATYRMIKEESKPLVIYILNATQLAVNDDNELLNHVSESMKVGGKQSKDRFLFVVNKLDSFKAGEDSVESAIEKVKKYLEDKGIENPNIYPAAALPALDIRTHLKGVKDVVPIITAMALGEETEPDMVEAAMGISKLNNNKQLHLEKYAPKIPSIQGKIVAQLAKAKEENNKCEEALIHTGIPVIEETIKTYVKKYANTSKIKNIVDTFSKKVESAKIFEQTKDRIIKDKESQNEVLESIKEIKRKLLDGDQAKKFSEKVNNINYDKEISEKANKILSKANSDIRKKIESLGENQISINEAEDICRKFRNQSEDIQAEVKVELEKIIKENVQNSAQALLEEYKEKIKDLNISEKNSKINPFEILNGSIEQLVGTSKLIDDLAETQDVKVGENWIGNANKKWYKPWTWLQEKGHFEDIYEKRELVDTTKLSQRFWAPIQKTLIQNGQEAIKYSKEETKTIKRQFKEKFKVLDDALKFKLQELESCISANENIEKQITETQEKLEWIQDIQEKIRKILDI